MNDILGIPRTALDVFKLLPEGTACEVIDNALRMKAIPDMYFQEIYSKILCDLHVFVKTHKYGTVLSRCDVYLNGGNTILLPDIIFISKANEHIIEKKGIVGAPTLAIEITLLDEIHDFETKLSAYRANAISEYIIIDPQSKEVWHYLLDGDQYLAQPSSPSKLHINTINFDLEL